MNGELIVVDDVRGEFAERVIEAFHGRPDESFCIALSPRAGRHPITVSAWSGKIVSGCG